MTSLVSPIIGAGSAFRAMPTRTKRRDRSRAQSRQRTTLNTQHFWRGAIGHPTGRCECALTRDDVVVTTTLADLVHRLSNPPEALIEVLDTVRSSDAASRGRPRPSSGRHGKSLEWRPF